MKRSVYSRLKMLVAIAGLIAVVAQATQVMAAKQLPTSPVNINTASVEELMQLPGIGKVRAEAIVARRAQTPFASVEELMEIKGLNEGLIAKLTPYVIVSGKATPTGTAGKVVKTN